MLKFLAFSITLGQSFCKESTAPELISIPIERVKIERPMTSAQKAIKLSSQSYMDLTEQPDHYFLYTGTA